MWLRIVTILTIGAAVSCSQESFVTDVPLRVVQTAPSGGSVDADRHGNIQVTFSETLTPSSVGGAIVLMALGDPNAPGQGTAVQATVSYSDTPVPTATLVPATPLPFSTLMQVQISTAITRARDGAPLPVPVKWTFQTLNPPPLMVVQVEPGDAATEVGRSQMLSVTFSEPVNCASLAAGSTLVQYFDPNPREANQTSSTVSGTWNCPTVNPQSASVLDGTDCTTTPTDCVVTFIPTNPNFLYDWSSNNILTLQGGSASSPVVSSARATLYGGQLASTYMSTFKTVDPPPLAVIGETPGNLASGVALSPNIVLQFSEPPDCSVLANPNIVAVNTVLDSHPRLGGGTAPLPGIWTCPPPSSTAPYACAPGSKSDPCTVTFTPSSTAVPLIESTLLTLDLIGGAYAPGVPYTVPSFVEGTRVTTYGGTLPDNFYSNFRVLDPVPELVTNTSPGNAATEVIVSPPTPIVIDLSRPVACITVNNQTVTTNVTLWNGTQSSYTYNIACTDGAQNFSLIPAVGNLPYAYPYSATIAVTLSGGPFGQNVPAPYPDDAIEASDATTRGGQLPSDYTFIFHTEDPPPLLVTETSPSGGGSGIAVSAPIDVQFNQPLDCNSVTSSTVVVTQTYPTMADPALSTPPPAPVLCTFTCPIATDPNQASFQCAHAPLTPSAQVSVALMGSGSMASSLRSQVATATGGFLSAPAPTYSFRVADPAPLTVVSTTPNGNPGINVSANTDVRFTFSRPVHCASAVSNLTLTNVTTGMPVPGTVTCTDGVSVGPQVNGATVIFTPSAGLTVTDTYQATAVAGITSEDATVVGGVTYGTLPQNSSVQFDVAYEDLQIVSTVPVSGSPIVPTGTTISIQFNQDLSIGSLVPCTPSVQTGCNFWINEGTVPTQSQAIDLTYVTYSNSNNTYIAVYKPSDPNNTPNLKATTQYVVNLLSGTPGPVGANGISRLPVAYSWTFTTSSTTLIAAVTPASGATGVAAEDPVCVQFVDNVNVASLTAGGQNQITATYTDAFGRTSVLPLDANTPYLVTGVAGLTQNYVCLNISSAYTPCYPGLRRLLYSTTYTANVSTQVQVGSGNQSLSSPFGWTFATRTPPQISAILKQNAVINETLSNNDVDVPVNSAFVVQFAEVMDANTLTSANISVVASGSSAAVTTTVTPNDPNVPTSALVTVSPSMSFLSGSAGTGSYSLQLLGGAGGLATLSGSYLGADTQISFTTSPATTITISPPESSLAPTFDVPIDASRPLYLPSVTSQTVFAMLSGSPAPITGIVAEQALQPQSVVYIANPTYLTGSNYIINTGVGLLDYRGNPVNPQASQTYGVGTAPASSATVPATSTYTAVTPPAPGSTTDGSQVFMFYPAFASSTVRDRMLGTSYYASAPGQTDGTIALIAQGGSGCTAAGTRLSLTVTHQAGANTTTGDSVTIAVNKAPYMRAGCQYALMIHQDETANVYDQAPATTGCGGTSAPTDIISTSTTCPSSGLLYTGESIAPTLTTLQVQQVNGALVTASGATGVAGNSSIIAVFDEPIDPSSVAPTTFAVSGGVSGTYAVNGNVITWTPTAHFVANTSYTVTLGSIADLAGNTYAGSTATFTVENTTPTFLSATWNAAVTRAAAYGTAILGFSEPVDPLTISVNTAAGLGSISPANTSGELFGCASTDPNNASQVLWTPTASLGTSAVTVTVNPSSASSQLADMAGTSVTSGTQQFTP